MQKERRKIKRYYIFKYPGSYTSLEYILFKPGNVIGSLQEINRFYNAMYNKMLSTKNISIEHTV